MKKVKLLVEDEHSEVFLKFVKTLDYVKILEEGISESANDLEEGKSKNSDDHIKEPLKKFLNKM